MAINKVVLSGNLTRAPELRTTQSGIGVLRFGVAVDERRRDSDGKWVDYPNYFDCVIFGNRADGLSDKLAKGQKVCLCGRLRQRRWKADDGTSRSKVDVIVDDLEFIPKERQTKPASGDDLLGYDIEF